MKKLLLLVGSLFLITLAGCSDILDALIEEEEPTKDRMQGLWEVTEAYDDSGNSVLSDVKFPKNAPIASAFHLSNDNTVVSTAGPLVMYLVYGNTFLDNYTSIASKIDEVFKYAGNDFTGGEWFIEPGVVDSFTLEMKLEGLPGQKTIVEILDLLGIGNGYLDQVIYHKFVNMTVTLDDDSTMVWELEEGRTTARYNKKNGQGDYVLWEGFPADKFVRARLVLTKRLGDISDLIE